MFGDQWTKSSYSNSEGGNCVEARQFALTDQWAKSSHSNSEGGDCVEARGMVTYSQVGIRDTQNRHLGHLEIPAAEWTALLRSATVHD
ncbi:DUF397 domain-containing protein [Nocardiopsis protaetiae]|uniref:DUF397 domain-containing protein n=1 Tax=Nocardiopsis protaetiae TaxID=3382270 RepID=UPI00387AA7C8